MSQSTISIRVESSLKEKFDALCEAFGLSTTAAFSVFMKTVVRERRIPFEIRADNESTQRKKALEAFHALRIAAGESDMTEMSLEDINAEIKSFRDERTQDSFSGH